MILWVLNVVVYRNTLRNLGMEMPFLIFLIIFFYPICFLNKARATTVSLLHPRYSQMNAERACSSAMVHVSLYTYNVTGSTTALTARMRPTAVSMLLTSQYWIETKRLRITTAVPDNGYGNSDKRNYKNALLRVSCVCYYHYMITVHSLKLPGQPSLPPG